MSASRRAVPDKVTRATRPVVITCFGTLVVGIIV